MTDEPQGNQKDVWDKAKIIGGFLIPIAVLIAGYWVNTTIKDREIRANAVAIQSIKLANESAKERESALQRFALAVSVLRTPANDDSESTVREWALGEFQEFTGIPSETVESLLGELGEWFDTHDYPVFGSDGNIEALESGAKRMCRMLCAAVEKDKLGECVEQCLKTSRKP